jgi:hypothetical protein
MKKKKCVIEISPYLIEKSYYGYLNNKKETKELFSQMIVFLKELRARQK